MTDTQALDILKAYFGGKIQLNAKHGLHLVGPAPKYKMDFPGKKHWDSILATLKKRHSIE